MTGGTAPGELARAALGELGVRRLVLAIHGASFPSDPGEDLGAGAPGTAAGARLLALASDLGFTCLQLGPGGETSAGNPSPYDSTIFSRAIAFVTKAVLSPGGELAGLVHPAMLDAITGTGDDRGDHRRSHETGHMLVAAAYAAFRRGARPDLAPRLEAFRRAQAWWLERDARYAAREHAVEPDAYAFAQLLAHVEHDRMRRTAAGLGLELFADLQVGLAPGDAWAHAGAFLSGYVMGAPPSRTNPDGQPWNYPVLDPDGARPRGASLALVEARAAKAFAEHDGLRVDHPHGLVCPWVYRAGAPDPAVAVRHGARLHESPDLADHPDLARFARVRPEQIDHALPRYADHWVRAVEPAQVDRYAVFVDAIVAAARRYGKDTGAITCEVLSTQPVPLGAVLARHGLGRWRVLQKADLGDASDVYRAENAARADWVMIGNHDTAPIFGLHAAWDAATRGRWAEHLAHRLALAPAAVPALAGHAGLFASAMLAELFACPAENVLVFFADLFGETRRFNTPGTSGGDNWALRLPADFAARYADRLASGAALDLPLALALALRARGGSPALVSRLAAAAGTPLPAAAARG